MDKIKSKTLVCAILVFLFNLPLIITVDMGLGDALNTVCVVMLRIIVSALFFIACLKLYELIEGWIIKIKTSTGVK